MPGPAAACKMCGASFAPRGRGTRAFCRRCTAKADREARRALRMDCKECGKRFSASRRSDRYCSRECSAERTRRNSLEYVRRILADPEKRAVFLARTRIAAAARRAENRGGRPPPPPPRGIKKAEPSTCRLCGRIFVPSGYVRHASYCRRCTARADREVGRTLRVDCKACGKKFSTTNRAVRYCSDECRAEGLRRSRRESKHRMRADPEKRALAAAQMRARSAARGSKARR